MAKDVASELTPDDWAAILDALEEAVDEVSYDLEDTRNSDFYDDEERQRRKSLVKNWERLCDLIAPLTNKEGS